RSARSSIEPFRSANSTVTCLRSPSRALLEARIFFARCWGVYASGEPNRDTDGVGSGATGKAGVGEPGCGVATASEAPQPPQNFSPDSLAKPHEGHATASAAPHSEQNRRPGRFSVPHREHFIRAAQPARRGWPWGARAAEVCSQPLEGQTHDG